MRDLRLAAVALAIALPSAAAAQDAPLSLMLACDGTDVTTQQVGATTTVTVVPGVAPTIGSAQHRAAVAAATTTTQTSTTPEYRPVRVAARMSVTVQGDVVRVRPSQYGGPSLLNGRRSPDGWYDLTEVAITDAQIRGKASWGGLLAGKYRLEIDRRTGDVRFGGFTGVCEKAASSPEARKF